MSRSWATVSMGHRIYGPPYLWTTELASRLTCSLSTAWIIVNFFSFLSFFAKQRQVLLHTVRNLNKLNFYFKTRNHQNWEVGSDFLPKLYLFQIYWSYSGNTDIDCDWLIKIIIKKGFLSSNSFFIWNWKDSRQCQFLTRHCFARNSRVLAQGEEALVQWNRTIIEYRSVTSSFCKLFHSNL